MNGNTFEEERILSLWDKNGWGCYAQLDFTDPTAITIKYFGETRVEVVSELERTLRRFSKRKLIQVGLIISP